MSIIQTIVIMSNKLSESITSHLKVIVAYRLSENSKMSFNDKFCCPIAMHKRWLCRPAVSVCPSVTFMYSVETNKRIFKKISPSGSHTILVSGTRRCGINIPTGTP